MLKKIILAVALVIAYKTLIAQLEAPTSIAAAETTTPWQLGTPSPLITFINGENEPNKTVAISEDGSVIAALNQNGEVKATRWHPTTGWDQPTELHTKKNDGFLAGDIAMNKDGSIVFIAAIRGPVNALQYENDSRSWKKHIIIESLEHANTAGIETNAEGTDLFINIKDSLYRIAYDPKTKHAGNKTTLMDFSLLHTIYKTKNVQANSFDINDAGTVVATAHEVGLARVNHFNSKTQTWEVPLTAIEISSPIQKVAISGDGSTVVAATKNGAVFLSYFDTTAKHWTPQVSVTDMKQPLSLLKLNQDGSAITIGTQQGTIITIACTPKTGSCQAPATLFAVPDAVKIMAINGPETRVFISNLDDGDIKVFDKK